MRLQKCADFLPVKQIKEEHQVDAEKDGKEPEEETGCAGSVQVYDRYVLQEEVGIRMVFQNRFQMRPYLPVCRDPVGIGAERLDHPRPAGMKKGCIRIGQHFRITADLPGPKLIIRLIGHMNRIDAPLHGKVRRHHLPGDAVHGIVHIGSLLLFFPTHINLVIIHRKVILTGMSVSRNHPIQDECRLQKQEKDQPKPLFFFHIPSFRCRYDILFPCQTQYTSTVVNTNISCL